MKYQIWKRAAACALTAALMITPALAAGSGGPTVPKGWINPFSDVRAESWYYRFVADLNSRGVIDGYDDGRFGVRDNTKAGESILMIVKAAGSGEQGHPQGTHYATGYIDYAVNHGWLDRADVPENLSGSISRLFIAHLAARALGLEPSTRGTSPFADVDDGYVTTLYAKGIVAGSKENGQQVFKPQEPITRAELSAIIWRVMDYADNGETGSGTPEPEGPKVQIPFQDQLIDVVPGVPVNAYDDGAFALKNGRMSYTGKGVEVAQGIDVAYYQGNINWKKVANDGIDFAMIRLGGRYYGRNNGTVFEDSKFRVYMEGALNAGLDVGVYFFSQATSVAEAREEARFVLERLKGYHFNGPVVFDWENIDYDEARTDGMTAAGVTAAANAFCQMVEGAGYQPMIYFNRYIAYLLYDLGDVAQYPFWIAEYSTTPKFYYDFTMWQYTNKGMVDGIEGPVDMNIRITKK